MVNATCVELDLSLFRVKGEIISKEEIRDAGAFIK